MKNQFDKLVEELWEKWKKAYNTEEERKVLIECLQTCFSFGRSSYER